MIVIRNASFDCDGFSLKKGTSGPWKQDLSIETYALIQLRHPLSVQASYPKVTDKDKSTKEKKDLSKLCPRDEESKTLETTPDISGCLFVCVCVSVCAHISYQNP